MLSVRGGRCSVPLFLVFYYSHRIYVRGEAPGLPYRAVFIIVVRIIWDMFFIVSAVYTKAGCMFF